MYVLTTLPEVSTGRCDIGKFHNKLTENSKLAEASRLRIARPTSRIPQDPWAEPNVPCQRQQLNCVRQLFSE